MISAAITYPASGITITFAISGSYGARIPEYREVKDDIEKIVSMKASSYKIPGYDVDDIAQEIRLVAFKALGKYNPEKNHSTPFHFMARCVDNYLINLKRDNDSYMSKSKLAQADDRTLERLDKKRKLYYPASLAEDEFNDNLNIERAPEYDAHDNILSVLPSGFHSSYWLLINHGPEAISKKHLTQIRKVVRTLYG